MIRSFILLLLFPFVLKAQNLQKISGTVNNAENEALPGVNIAIKANNIATVTDSQGRFQLSLANGTYKLFVSYLGYQTKVFDFEVITSANPKLKIVLTRNLQSLKQVVVSDESVRNIGMIKVDARLATSNPNISQSFEAILKQLPGVSTNNELSSQYSVRGGNFDENLI